MLIHHLRGLRLKRFESYILYRLISHFCFFSIILTFVYWSNRSIRMLDLLLGDGKSIGLFANLTFLSLPNIILAILPVSGLIATIYLTIKLNGDSELTALKSAGTSDFELSKPYLKMGLIVSLSVGLLSHQIVPIVKSSAKGIENSVSNEISAMILKSGEFFTPAKNITMYIGRLSANKEMNNFFLEDSRDPNKIKTFTSETAFLAGTKDSPQIVLKNGSAQTYLTQKKSLDILYFKDFLYDFKLLYEKKVSQRSETVREVTTPKLIHLMREVNISENEYEAYAFEIHSRVLQTLLPAVIIMLGFSCLIKVNFSRQMSWTPTIITIIFLILLKLSGDYCEDLTRSGFFGVWGLYLTPVIGGLIVLTILLYPNARMREKINK